MNYLKKTCVLYCQILGIYHEEYPALLESLTPQQLIDEAAHLDKKIREYAGVR